MTAFTTYEKATIEVHFYSKIPNRFEIYDSNGELYFFRNLTPNNSTIKVNIAKADNFKTNAECYIKILPIEIIQIRVPLPPKEKDFFHEKFTFRYNPNLKGTPARNFYRKGLIEYGPEFTKLPYPIRIFIMCHEVGHSYYHDEEKADLFACKMFLQMGYNGTSALYSLTDVLNYDSKQNKFRIKRLYNILNNR